MSRRRGEVSRSLVPVLAAALILAGCEDRGVPPVQPPPPSTVSYAADVQPIFDAQCVGCHGAGGTAGLDLRAGASHGNLVDVAATGYAAVLVVRGDPDASVLYNKLADTGLFGGIMPAGGPSLSEDQLGTVRSWIAEGAQDN